jgi:hypothetical protein|tara:strand:+ start:996 stop:1496 length:501 start_codon:yes stop_codon:yes gene_type:complete
MVNAMITYNPKQKYIRPSFEQVEALLKKVPNESCDKVICHNDRLTFWIANLDWATICCGFSVDKFNHLLQKYKINLTPFVKLSDEQKGLNREQTKVKVYEMLSDVITSDSKMTKGALIKYVRDNWNEKTIMSDVGRVASKVINEKTGNSFSKWQICTTQRHIRKVK